MFAQKLIEKTTAEYAAFANGTETQSPLRKRIGEYWAFIGRPDLDGADQDVPWAAVFVSFMVQLAGAGSSFPYSAQHSNFFYRTINDKITKKAASFWGYRPVELTVQAGDILGMNRNTPPIDYDFASHTSSYQSHSDIVVDVQNGVIRTIGGNIGGRIGRSSSNGAGPF